MTTVDNRVVSIDFDNKDFEAKAAATIATLEKLSGAMNFSGAKAGFGNISSAANGVDLHGIGAGVDNISSKFSALGAIGFEVMRKITDGALGMAGRLKGLVFDPISQGGKQRALNIEQADFQFRGLGVDVTKAMESANTAVLGTAYGLDAAAKEAAQLSASGVKVGADMTTALRATAGAAAMTGSSFQDISQIFTTIAGVGKVGNQQLLEFGFRGVNASAAIAKQMGITEAQVHKMAADGKLSFAQFATAMDGAFGAHAQDANQTYAGSLANVHAALSRIGAAFQAPLLEGKRDVFNALTGALKGVKDALKPVIDTFAVLSKVKLDKLADWIKKLNFGGLQFAMPAFAKGLLNITTALGRVLKPIGQAFRTIFPKNMTKTLLSVSTGFAKITAKLIPNKKTMHEIKTIFTAVFSVMKLGIVIVKGIIGMFGKLTGGLVQSSGGFVAFVAHISDVISWCIHFLLVGDKIGHFFSALGQFIEHPIRSLEGFRKSMDNASGSVGKTKSWFLKLPGAEIVMNIVGRLKDRFQELSTIPGRVSNAFHALTNFFHPFITAFQAIGRVLGQFFTDLKNNLKTAFSKADFNSILDALNLGLLGGIVLLFKRFFEGGISLDFSRGFFGRASRTLSSVSRQLSLMQTKLKAEALLKIAEAIAVMAVSMIALSLVDSGKLTKALAAMAVGFGQLAAVFVLLDKVGGSNEKGKPAGASGVKLNAIGIAMIEMSVAVTVLSVAVGKLSKIKAGDLVKATTAITVLLADLAGSTRIFAKDPKGIVRAGLALIEMAIALNIMALAVKQFAKIKAGDMGKALLSISISLWILVNAINGMPETTVLKAVALIELSIALNILAVAVKSFGNLSWKQIAKGLLSIFLILGMLVGAMDTIPPEGMIGIGTGLIAVGIALNIIALAVKTMGGMKLGTMVKGIGAIAAILAILAIGLNAMDGALPGAAAIIVAALAMELMAKVIKTFGDMKISEIVTGLLAMVAAIILIGAVSAVLGLVSPLIFAFGVALTTVGIGMVLFGEGANLLGKGIEAIAKGGVGAAKSMNAIINSIVAEIPGVIAALAKGIVDGITTILSALPTFIKAFGAVFDALLNLLIKETPKFLKLVSVLLTGLLMLFDSNIPMFVKAGFDLLMAFLSGLDQHIDEITKKAVDILVKFIGAIGDNIQGIIDAGVNLLVQFLTGIASDSKKIIDAATLLINTFILGIGGMASSIATAATAALKTFLNGLSKDVKAIGEAATNLINTIIWTIAGMGTSIGDSGAAALAAFLNGIANNIKTVCGAAHNVVDAFTHCLSEVFNTIVTTGGTALGSFVFGIMGSAGRLVFAGAEIVGRFVSGLLSGLNHVVNAGIIAAGKFMEGILNSGLDLVGEGLKIAGHLVDGLVNGLQAGMNRVAPIAKSLGKLAADAIGLGALVHSPSRITLAIGGHIAAGLALGMANDKTAEASGQNLGLRAANAVQSALNELPSMLVGMDEFNPTITPVLDLSSVQADAKKIGTIIGLPTISPDVSYASAAVIATATDSQNGSGSTPKDAAPTIVNFEQNNYSPKALSTNDIYSKTNSQIALAKEKLKIP